MQTANIKIQPFWRRWFCIHNYTRGVRVIYDSKGRKRHAKICLKCGQRDYLD